MMQAEPQKNGLYQLRLSVGTAPHPHLISPAFNASRLVPSLTRKPDVAQECGIISHLGSHLTWICPRLCWQVGVGIGGATGYGAELCWQLRWSGEAWGGAFREASTEEGTKH